MLPKYAGQFIRTNQAACTGEALDAFLVEKVLMMMTCTACSTCGSCKGEACLDALGVVVIYDASYKRGTN